VTVLRLHHYLIIERFAKKIRFGTCGGISERSVPGNIVIASAGAGFVTRNVDAFSSNYDTSNSYSEINPKGKYSLSKIAPSNSALSALVIEELGKSVGSDILTEGVNVTADSFYSSQGRKDDNFHDDNDDVIATVRSTYPNAVSLEMETFMLFHLAKCARGAPIAASAAAIVLANRLVGEALEADRIETLEEKGGKALLHALIRFPLTIQTSAL
jgi:uridine phosphorylase